MGSIREVDSRTHSFSFSPHFTTSGLKVNLATLAQNDIHDAGEGETKRGSHLGVYIYIYTFLLKLQRGGAYVESLSS